MIGGVGFWVARYRGDRRRTLWHYVESEIADRAVTTCGRQMVRVNDAGDALTFASMPNPDVACEKCMFPAFVASLTANGERSGWESQNEESGAYGKFQLMPEVYEANAPLALGTSKDRASASKDIPPAQWVPTPTRENQTKVATWMLRRKWENHAGDAQRVAGAWNAGDALPPWSRRVAKYINRVCVPLGYSALPVPERTEGEPE